MRRSLQAILFLKAFMLGTSAPVFILLLTSHGATVQTVSLFVGAASLFTLLAEFPSGVFADLFGRKLSFILSLLLQLAGFSLLLSFRSACVLAGVMVLYGLSRAFASGSIEALAIDEAGDKAKLVRVTSRLNILDSTGLALGALFSGVLAGLSGDYAGNIIFNIAGFIVILFLTLFTVRESEHINTQKGHPPSLKEHLQKSFSFVRGSRTARMLFVLCSLTAFAMVTVETYWQPAVKAFTSSTLVFGLIGCIGFAGVVAGSKLSEYLLTRLPQSGVAVFLLSKALMGVCLALLIAANTQVPFILIYVFWYIFLGGNGVAEQTLLNREAPAAQRASILSLLSLVFRIGSLLASLLCYYISSNTDYRYSWLFAAGLLAAATLAFAVPSLRRRGADRQGLVQPGQDVP